ncbi:hypothetical protein SESBI_23496 [Sesbania bispinosa]|nr:hypothetical protein SESBI_23496 [Sesbania bispinosa]
MLLLSLSSLIPCSKSSFIVAGLPLSVASFRSSVAQSRLMFNVLRHPSRSTFRPRAVEVVEYLLRLRHPSNGGSFCKG